MIYAFNSYRPVIDPSSFIHPQAAVTGNVIIGKGCYVGPGAALRGDWGEIIIEDGCNVQENCVLHMFPGLQVILRKGTHVGHGAIIHGAEIGENCLIGMNAVILDNVILGNESIVGALTLIREKENIPARSLIVGNPGKIIKQVSDEMIGWKTKGTELYQRLPAECFDTLKECDPLPSRPPGRQVQDKGYSPRK